MKVLSKSKIWLFAVGQFGWSIMSGLIANWLVYVYQPNIEGSTFYIPQGLVVLGVITIVGAITAFGRVFDAFTDPWIASKSDRCKSDKGRRIPFLKWASLPLAASTVLVFCAPVNHVSWINVVWLSIFVLFYYVSITAYCAPYNALISELGHTQQERMTISTAISLTFILGTAFSMQAASIWGIFEGSGMERMTAIRLTFVIFAVIAFVCMLVPVVAIDEKSYVNTKPSEANAFSSLKSTFSNRNFRRFVASDIFYWIALTMFQTGLTFFVTSLLDLDEGMGGTLFALMTVLSLIFYLPINIIVKKVGKKKMVLVAFAMFALVYLYTGFLGDAIPLSNNMQGILLAAFASLPIAIFGILPQAIVADVADADAKVTGENREGMFFAARTFAFKLGQSIAMLIFTSLATIGKSASTGVSDGTGYRVVAFTAFGLCLVGGIILFFYNEKEVNHDLELTK